MNSGRHVAGSPRRAYLYLALAVLCWSGNWLLGRAMHAEITPLGLNFWRWATALAILLPFTAAPLWRARGVLRRRWRMLALLGFLSVALFQTLVYLALQSTTAINAALFNSTAPIHIVLLSWLLFRDAISRRQALGIALSLAGVLAIVLRGELHALVTLRFTPGDLWAIAALPVWALYTVLLRRRPAELAPMVFVAALALLGFAMLLPCYLAELALGSAMVYTRETVLTILYTGAFASALAFWLWNSGVEIVGANRAGVIVHLLPVYTTVLAIAFLGERLQAYHLAGIALIFAGIYLTTVRGATRPAPATAPLSPPRG